MIHYLVELKSINYLMNTLKNPQTDTLLLYYIKLFGLLSISRTGHDFGTNNHYVFFIVCTVRHTVSKCFHSRSFTFGVACFCQELEEVVLKHQLNWNFQMAS